MTDEFPDPPAMVPVSVRAAACGQAVRLAWRNELGGLTFEAGQGASRRFVKWSPAASGIDLAAEAERLRWAAPFHAAPRVLAHGADATPDGRWSGHVDFDLLEFAYRWADSAVATWTPSGTSARAGSRSCSTPTASHRTPSGPGTTGCCGTSARDLARDSNGR